MSIFKYAIPFLTGLFCLATVAAQGVDHFADEQKAIAVELESDDGDRVRKAVRDLRRMVRDTGVPLKELVTPETKAAIITAFSNEMQYFDRDRDLSDRLTNAVFALEDTSTVRMLVQAVVIERTMDRLLDFFGPEIIPMVAEYSMEPAHTDLESMGIMITLERAIWEWGDNWLDPDMRAHIKQFAVKYMKMYRDWKEAWPMESYGPRFLFSPDYAIHLASALGDDDLKLMVAALLPYIEELYTEMLNEEIGKNSRNHALEHIEQWNTKPRAGKRQRYEFKQISDWTLNDVAYERNRRSMHPLP